MNEKHGAQLAIYITAAFRAQPPLPRLADPGEMGRVFVEIGLLANYIMEEGRALNVNVTADLEMIGTEFGKLLHGMEKKDRRLTRNDVRIILARAKEKSVQRQSVSQV